MKSTLVSLMLFTAMPFSQRQQHTVPDFQPPSSSLLSSPSSNLIIITIDGFRWQEIFTGADSTLLYNTPGNEINQLLFWDNSSIVRREKLMPFFWNVVAKKGQVYGNRQYDNKVDASNFYALSYPGYNEMFTGNPDNYIGSNRKIYNDNINILEYLNNKPAFKDRVAAFTSWDVFPYILNEKRNSIYINSGYDNTANVNESSTEHQLNLVQDKCIAEKTATRHDMLTFIAAKEYLVQHKPRIFYLGLGETDEFAHEGRYDLYLQQASNIDRMLAELWQWVQTTPGYKDNTTLLITTDHGRGQKASKWTTHGAWIKGSLQVWLAAMGPGIEATGEQKNNQQFYLAQLAQTIAGLMGEKFEGKSVANAISFERIQSSQRIAMNTK